MIARTLSLMQNRGYGWSKAMMLAEDSLDLEGRPTPPRRTRKPKAQTPEQKRAARIAALIAETGCTPEMAEAAIAESEAANG